MIQSNSIPTLILRDIAWFFDVDGTLANIEIRPELATIPVKIKQALCEISKAANGALALISGRPIVELDRLSAPLHGPAAGVHGAERRDAFGELHYVDLSTSLKATLAQELKIAITAFDGCYVEEKGMAFTLHYRQGPQYQKNILALAQDIVRRYPELVLQPGKFVVELNPVGVDKGMAIAAFMREAPFAGRTPLFIGDDLNDEAGFRQVNALRGFMIKVGPGSSVAHYHLNDVNQVHQWIMKLAEKQKNQSIKTKI